MTSIIRQKKTFERFANALNIDAVMDMFTCETFSCYNDTSNSLLTKIYDITPHRGIDISDHILFQHSNINSILRSSFYVVLDSCSIDIRRFRCSVILVCNSKQYYCDN